MTATLICWSRHRTRRGRPITGTAAAVCMSATEPSAGRTRSATIGPSTRAIMMRRASSSTPNTRWCGGWRPTATKSATSGAEAARTAGIHLAFFSGNEIFWKTRWENSIDGSGTPYRTLVTYKETLANDKIDPLPNVWTGTWRDPRFTPPADGGRPENALTGTLFSVDNQY